jgi:FkbM family methyltransferase
MLRASFQNDPKWQGLQIALGEKSRTAAINVIPRCTVLSSLLQPIVPSETETEQVEVKRLDELFSTLVLPISTPRVFLKLDTQGYDLKVLEGATA